MNHSAYASSEQYAEGKRMALLVYILQALSFVVGITYPAALVLNYLKWPLVADTWLEAHFRWQVNTFWFSLLWGVVGWMLVFIWIGYLVWIANTLWVIYRIAVGWLALNENRAPV